MTATLEQADDLVALAAERGAVLQVGHIERFNPATASLLSAGRGARFVEVHRLGSFSPRSLDIDVILDLMVHDLDIVLCLDGTEPVSIEAVGVPVLTPRVDIAKARLKFASGLIANLTASRVSVEKVRKFRVFAPRTYVSADFTAREAQVYRLEADEGGRPRIASAREAAPEQEPLRLQIEAFARGVRGITGNDVVKEAFDMVLTDDNFASVEAAVKEGRGVFDNLTKFIIWTLPTNLGEGLVILSAIITGVTLPILPVQILWINTTTAVLLGLMLAFEPKEPGIMERAPRNPKAPILDATLVFRIIMVSVLLMIGAFGLFELEMARGGNVDLARTLAVNLLIFGELFNLFSLVVAG